MSKLEVGAQAPEFELRDVDGNAHSLAAGASPLTLAIFFKTTCPTCQYAWPYYERLHKAYAAAGLRVLGISQHDRARTANYASEYNATFPHLLDDGYFVSRAYDPDYVPNSFLIDRDGTVLRELESWDTRQINELSAGVAEQLGVAAQSIVTPHDNAAARKLG